MRYCLLIVLIWVSPRLLPAQRSSSESAPALKYWVLFEDQPAGIQPVPETAPHVTREALARRALRTGRGLTRLDLPVYAPYVARLERLGIDIIHESRWLHGVSARLDRAQLEQVSRLPFVRQIRRVGRLSEPPPIPEISPAPSQVATSALDFGASLTQLQAIDAVVPLENGWDGSGVRLGFLDTRFDTTQPAFEHLVQDGRIIAQQDFTGEIGPQQPNMHGLWTSSVAVGLDEGSLIGPCHGGELALATTEYAPSETNAEEDAFVAGLEWLEGLGVDVVNVSLGYNEFDDGENSYVYADMDGDTAIPTIASDIAASLGVVVVTSAGNAAGCGDPESCWYYITSPADGDSVVAAGASLVTGEPASFSSRGPTFDGRTKPEVAALGSGVVYANNAGGYWSGSGTSFSAPLVSGVVCQMLEANPNLQPTDVIEILKQTASQSDTPDNNLGWGIVSASLAVDSALARRNAVALAASVLLEGAYAGSGIMNVAPTFRAAIPKHQPYSASLYSGGPLEASTSDSLNVDRTKIIDWIVLSLRTGLDPSTEVAGSRRPALLLEDGSVANADGSVPFVFDGTARGLYRVVVCHRNHLCAMSENIDFLDGTGVWNLSGDGTAFSAGLPPVKTLPDGRFALFAGNAIPDSDISPADREALFSETATGLNGYLGSDFTFDGSSQVLDYNVYVGNAITGASSQVP